MYGNSEIYDWSIKMKNCVGSLHLAGYVSTVVVQLYMYVWYKRQQSLYGAFWVVLLMKLNLETFLDDG